MEKNREHIMNVYLKRKNEIEQAAKKAYDDYKDELNREGVEPAADSAAYIELFTEGAEWADLHYTRRYIRFGEIPENEQSDVYDGENVTGKLDGVSVYYATENEYTGEVVLGLPLPVTRTSLATLQSLIDYSGRKCYLVEGDYIGRGTDNEPLIKNVKIIRELIYK
jgi:hypothetical protein